MKTLFAGFFLVVGFGGFSLFLLNGSIEPQLRQKAAINVLQVAPVSLLQVAPVAHDTVISASTAAVAQDTAISASTASVAQDTVISASTASVAQDTVISASTPVETAQKEGLQQNATKPAEKNKPTEAKGTSTSKNTPSSTQKKKFFPTPVNAWNRTLVIAPPNREALTALRSPAVVVCASSWNHYNHLKKMVGEFPQKGKFGGKQLPLVVYDLGLFPEDLEELRTKFPWADIRQFDYTKYPPFFDVRVEKGHYAWKPALVREVYQDYNTSVLWMDASNKFSNVQKIVQGLQQGKFISNSAGHRVRFLCHNGTWDYLQKKLSPGFNRNEIAWSKSCNGAFLGFGVKNPKVRRVLEEWYQCALVRDCIAPVNTSKANHRQDQAVVSILAHWQRVGQHCADFVGHGVTERRTDIAASDKKRTTRLLELHPELAHTHS